MILKKYLPDLLTAMNLLCGLVAVIFVFRGRSDIAFLLMLLAAVFDFSDGFAARVLKSYSAFGKELDSLSDLVSFGVLPSLMLYFRMDQGSLHGSLLCCVPVLIAVFSALRLAKFNIDERQHSSFIGLPTPAAAMIAGGLCHFVQLNPASALAAWTTGPVLIPVLSLCLCALSVSGIPMFSMKFSRGDSPSLKGKRIVFMVLAALILLTCLLFSLTWSLAVALVFVCYVLMNIFICVFRI